MDTNLEIAKNIHKYRAVWEMSSKDPNPLIIQAANDVVKEMNNKDQEFIREIILLRYKTLLNIAEIYNKELG